jgi:hypothetical protein
MKQETNPSKSFNQQIFRILFIAAGIAAVITVADYWFSSNKQTKQTTTIQTNTPVSPPVSNELSKQEIVQNRIQETLKKERAKKIADFEPGAGFFDDQKNWKTLDFPETGFSYQAPAGLTNIKDQIQGKVQPITTSFQYYRLSIPGNISGYAAYYDYIPEREINLLERANYQLGAIEATDGNFILHEKITEIIVSGIKAVSIDVTFTNAEKVTEMRSILAKDGLETWQITLSHDKDYEQGSAIIQRVFDSIKYTTK